MVDLRNLSPTAADDVRDIGPHMWARVYAKGARYSLMTTNACESWNAKILTFKDVPICHLVDYLRKTLMKWFSVRRQESNDWHHAFSKHAHEAIEERRILAMKCSVIHVIDEQYEINESDNQDQNIVDLVRKTCTCGVFTLEHFPCGHVMAVCQKIGVRWETLCGEYYRTSSWRGMYAPPIYRAMTCDWYLPEDVDATVVLHPNTGRGPDRPRGGRFRSAYERLAPSKGTRSCSNCHNLGHYVNTCLISKTLFHLS
ncbi:uncharacterized protein LOC113359814 [Papaver somniferum]|uniref:uncharacterized protein LOC113359814 n=1 Tax=Papaver somniferum TaxID=3469 RepID=UPI000E6FA20D|nr:uncharacterized protein LOC113359814 [Papaver somniferum]